MSKVEMLDFYIHWGKIGTFFYYLIINLIVIVPLILGMYFFVRNILLDLLYSIFKEKFNLESLKPLFIFLGLVLFVNISAAGFSDFFYTLPLSTGAVLLLFVYFIGFPMELHLIGKLYFWIKSLASKRLQ